MGKVKSELLDWEADDQEIMDDPVAIAWHEANYIECMEQQSDERFLKKSIELGKGDRQRPIANPKKFRENFDEIFRKRKKEKNNDRQNKRTD